MKDVMGELGLELPESLVTEIVKDAKNNKEDKDKEGDKDQEKKD